MTIPKSYEALAADLASEKILSKTLQGQKEEFMMLADSRKIELDDALARESELKSGLKTTLNDLHCRDDAVYGLRIDLKAEQDRESALREDLDALEEEFDTLEHTNITLKLSLTVAEQRSGDLEGLLRNAQSFVEQWDDDSQEWMDLSSAISNAIPCDSNAALKPSAEQAKNCQNCKVCMGSPDFPENFLINGLKP